MTRFIDVPALCRMVERVGVENFMAGIAASMRDDFSRWGMSKREWSSLVLQSGGPQPGDIVIKDLLLLGYPEEDGLYFSRFEMIVVDDGRETTSMIRLYWRRDKLGALNIVAEDVG